MAYNTSDPIVSLVEQCYLLPSEHIFSIVLSHILFLYLSQIRIYLPHGCSNISVERVINKLFLFKNLHKFEYFCAKFICR